MKDTIKAYDDLLLWMINRYRENRELVDYAEKKWGEIPQIPQN